MTPTPPARRTATRTARAVERIAIGRVEVVALLDNVVPCDPRSFLPGAGEQLLAAYPELLDDLQLMRLRTTCFLLRSAGRLVLRDSGFGPRRRGDIPLGELDQRLR